MMERPLVITVKNGNEARTRIWRDEKPFPIGYPYRWILERNGKGVRIRDLGKKGEGSGPAQGLGMISYVEPEVVDSGLAVLLPNSSAAVRIRPAATLAPAFASRPNPNGNLQVYSCMGTWSLGSHPVGQSYLGEIQGRRIFELRQGSGRYALIPAASDLQIETSTGTRQLAEGQIRYFETKEVAHLVVRFGQMSWVFSSVEDVAIPVLTAKDADPQWVSFQKSLKGSAVALLVLGLAAALWPRPEPRELLIPPQFTTVQLEKKPQKATAAPSASRAATSKSAAKAQVATAFRAQALHSAMNGLMKGGMTKLLENSDFTAGTDGSLAARKILDSQSNHLVSTAPVTGPMKARSITVASIGGGSLNGTGGKGKGVGYGGGDHATVGGQGKSFVSLDTGASSVEEGLTKDEVGEVIHRHLSEVRYCYESAMIRTPSVEGKLLMGFTINGNGIVRSAEVKSSTVSDSGVDDCVLRRLTSWKFPRTKGGIDVSVTYPFIFKSLGR